MYLPKIIGICGNINSGKNTVADYLRRQYMYRVRGFSDPLYEQMTILNPYIVEAEMRYNDIVYEMGTDSAKRYYSEIRMYLRLLGSECGRQIHGNWCWVAYLDRQIGKDKDDRTVIQGVRFPEEVDYIRARGGTLVLVRSPYEMPPDKTHSSEHSLDYQSESDFVLENVGTFEDLWHKIEEFLDGYTKVFPIQGDDV